MLWFKSEVVISQGSSIACVRSTVSGFDVILLGRAGSFYCSDSGEQILPKATDICTGNRMC